MAQTLCQKALGNTRDCRQHQSTNRFQPEGVQPRCGRIQVQGNSSRDRDAATGTVRNRDRNAALCSGTAAMYLPADVVTQCIESIAIRPCLRYVQDKLACVIAKCSASMPCNRNMCSRDNIHARARYAEASQYPRATSHNPHSRSDNHRGSQLKRAPPSRVSCSLESSPARPPHMDRLPRRQLASGR